jgi:hypothetical protein
LAYLAYTYITLHFLVCFHNVAQLHVQKVVKGLDMLLNQTAGLQEQARRMLPPRPTNLQESRQQLPLLVDIFDRLQQISVYRLRLTEAGTISVLASHFRVLSRSARRTT